MANEEYQKNYSENGFWNKIKTVSGKVGKSGILNALKLYYAMKLGKATAIQYASIIGALGYFICPVDAIPDIVPVLGFTDDIAVLSAAVAGIGACKDPEVVRMAQQKLDEWF